MLQVNQGVQEYADVFLKNAPDKFNQAHIHKLKAAYRYIRVHT